MTFLSNQFPKWCSDLCQLLTALSIVTEFNSFTFQLTVFSGCRTFSQISVSGQLEGFSNVCSGLPVTIVLWDILAHFWLFLVEVFIVVLFIVVGSCWHAAVRLCCFCSQWSNGVWICCVTDSEGTLTSFFSRRIETGRRVTSLALVGDDLRRLFWPPLNPPVVTRFSVPDPLDLKGVFRKPCGLCQQLEKLPVKAWPLVKLLVQFSLLKKMTILLE